MTFADRLRAARLRRALSARALDARAGLAAGHTAMIERGERTQPAALTVQRLAAALGVRAEWLLLGGGRRAA